MKAQIEWTGQVSFDATSGSGHTVHLDGPPDHGGENKGPRPMELVLMGVGGCSAFDVVHILKRARQPIEGCTAHLEAERVDDPPKVFRSIHIHFVVSGRGLDEKRVKRAVELSAEKYCSASIMLGRGGVEMTHSYEICELEPTQEGK